MDKRAKIFVAGHRGMVGSAIVRELQRQGYGNLVLRTRQELDLTDQRAVCEFFGRERPEYVFVAAARVGGIWANSTRPAEFIYENLAIQNNVIDGAYRAGVRKLLFLGSSCIYPREAPQPLKEEYLLAGRPEPTNQWYAVAKIAGIKLCQAYRRQYGCDFIAAMPTNLYGINDNYDPDGSHVIPALLRKFHEAKLGGQPAVTVWGSGRPRREFLYADDLARACLFLIDNYSEEEIINVGWGRDLAIAELAGLVAEIVGYGGEIVFDTDKPDGMMLKRLDVSRITALGWRPLVGLREGLQLAYDDMLRRLVFEQWHDLSPARQPGM
ncbi:MAG: GDP-L-fucose synthase [Negativicutes bacterium]|nr:GDP-L-fucose synthase [Negativicutes bacterium]